MAASTCDFIRRRDGDDAGSGEMGWRYLLYIYISMVRSYFPLLSVVERSMSQSCLYSNVV